MLIGLLVFLFVALCFVAKELMEVRRQVASIRQCLEWFGVGLLENRNPSPAQREYLEKVKEDLIREGKLSEQEVDLLRRRDPSKQI